MKLYSILAALTTRILKEAILCSFSGSYFYLTGFPKQFTCFNVQKPPCFSYTVHCSSTAIHPLLKRSVLAPGSHPEKLSLLWLVWSPPTMVLHQLWVFLQQENHFYHEHHHKNYLKDLIWSLLALASLPSEAANVTALWYEQASNWVLIKVARKWVPVVWPFVFHT